MLKLLQHIQKRLIIAIPIIMFAGFGAGLAWNLTLSELILKQGDFINVKVMDGGILMWPGELIRN